MCLFRLYFFYEKYDWSNHSIIKCNFKKVNNWTTTTYVPTSAFDYTLLRSHKSGTPDNKSYVALSGHYTDVIMTTVASQVTSLTVVYSTVYSDADKRKHQSSASLAFVRGIHRYRWIPRTKGQLRGKCFHLMTSSWLFSKRLSSKHFCQTSCQSMYNVVTL